MRPDEPDPDLGELIFKISIKKLNRKLIRSLDKSISQNRDSSKTTRSEVISNPQSVLGLVTGDRRSVLRLTGCCRWQQKKL